MTDIFTGLAGAAALALAILLIEWMADDEI